MIHHNFRMHRARVFLFLLLLLLMLVLVLDVRAIGINRSYLRACCECDQRNRAQGYGCNFFSHFLVVGQAPRLPDGQNGNRSGCPTNRTQMFAFYARTGGA